MTATVLAPGPPCHREVARAALPAAVSVIHVPAGGQMACVELDGLFWHFVRVLPTGAEDPGVSTAAEHAGVVVVEHHW